MRYMAEKFVTVIINTSGQPTTVSNILTRQICLCMCGLMPTLFALSEFRLRFTVVRDKSVTYISTPLPHYRMMCICKQEKLLRVTYVEKCWIVVYCLSGESKVREGKGETLCQH